jgi:hypothetical protein
MFLQHMILVFNRYLSLFTIVIGIRVLESRYVFFKSFRLIRSLRAPTRNLEQCNQGKAEPNRVYHFVDVSMIPVIGGIQRKPKAYQLVQSGEALNLRIGTNRHNTFHRSRRREGAHMVKKGR